MNPEERQVQKAIELQSMKQILTSVNDKIESMPGKTVIKEVSNPLTMTSLEYLSLSAEFISEAPLDYFNKYSVTIDDVKEGNIQIQNGSILLKTNKTYEFNLDIQLLPTKTGYSHVFLKDEASDNVISSALSFNGDYYDNTSGVRSFSSTIYTPSKDMSVSLGLHYPSSEGLRIAVRLNIQEIRNNPVNQYGGFESDVLFEGNANESGEYSLTNSIKDYNFLLVESNVDVIGGSKRICTNTEYISVDSVVLEKENQFMYFKYYETGIGQVFYTFSNENTLKIGILDFGAYESVQVTKITGIKGQLPSLLSGGEF